MKQTRLLPSGLNTFRITIDSYEDGEMKGKLNSIVLAEPVEFTSLTKLIILIDEIMDNEEELEIPRFSASPDKATFEIEVLFRQNYSWQGRLKWLGENREANFRSVLELIILIETILGQ